MVNDTIKSNRRRIKKESIQICGKIELRNKIYTKEICMNYHHFTIEERCCLRGILCQREKLSGNRKAFGQKRKFASLLVGER